MNRLFSNGLKQTRKLIVSIIGFTVLIIGLVLIVLPGPAFIVLPLGLAILASEFAWARLMLRKIRKKLRRSTQPDEPDSENHKKG